MNTCPKRIAMWAILLGLLLRGASLAQAADEAYNATITFCGGHRTLVENFRIVYAWREMPAISEGLTPYKLQARGERGLWVANRDQSTPAFTLIPFSQLDTIEFDSVVEQLNDSSIYQFRIQHVQLQRLDGKRITMSAEVLGDGTPVLWPRNAKVRFPEDLGDKRMDRVTVSLQGKTKLDGVDGEYLFVLPTSLSEANRSALTRARNSFPQKIQISRANSSATRTAQSGR